MVNPIAEGLWGLEHEVRLPAGVRMPVRMTAVDLGGGRLLLYSPVPIDDAAAEALAGLGEVAHLVAPSKLHHLWIEDAARRYPAAAAWLAPGLAARHPGLAAAAELGDRAPAAWGDRVDAARIAGASRLEETVLLHRPSGTLVCADLVFHVTRPANLRTRLVLGMMGVGGGRVAASRAWKRFVDDRAAARASVERILAWQPRRIVPAHGEVVEDARAALAGARLERLTGAPPPAMP